VFSNLLYGTLKTHLSINLSITVWFARWRGCVHRVRRVIDLQLILLRVCSLCMCVGENSCRRRRPVQSSVSAEMMKSASGQHEYGVDEPLELRTAPVVDGSDYVTRVLCTGCGRDFDVLRGDKTGYAPVLSAHAHGTPDVGTRSFAGCRSVSLEPEPARRSATKPSKKSSFQAVPSWSAASTDCGGTCACPGTSSVSDACVVSPAATCGRSRPDNERTYELWRSVDETQLSLS